MRKNNINSIIIFVVCFFGICYGINSIMSGNIYATLIRISIIPIIFLPKIINKLFKLKISDWSEFVYIIFVFCAHFLGSIINFYDKIYCYDKIIHFASGFVVSFFALEFLIKTKIYNPKKIALNIILLIAVSFMVAGLWEYFEFISDNVFNKDAQNVLMTGVTDTMTDMILATLGSCLFCLIYVFEEKNNKKIVIKNFIKQCL